LQAVSGGALAVPLCGEAQPTQGLPRIGILAGTTRSPSARANALVAGLGDFGHVDGQTVIIDWRLSGGQVERLPDLAADLVKLKSKVIVAADNPAIIAAQRATSTIPIVMVLALDPVASRFVASLARPGGNITGLTTQAPEVQRKALQLLK